MWEEISSQPGTWSLSRCDRMPCMSLTFSLIIGTVYQNIQQCQRIAKYFLLSLRLVELTDKNCYLVAFAVAKQKQDWDICFVRVYQTEDCRKSVSEDSSNMFSITQKMHLCADTKGKALYNNIYKKKEQCFCNSSLIYYYQEGHIQFFKKAYLKKIWSEIRARRLFF